MAAEEHHRQRQWRKRTAALETPDRKTRTSMDGQKRLRWWKRRNLRRALPPMGGGRRLIFDYLLFIVRLGLSSEWRLNLANQSQLRGEGERVSGMDLGVRNGWVRMYVRVVQLMPNLRDICIWSSVIIIGKFQSGRAGELLEGIDGSRAHN